MEGRLLQQTVGSMRAVIAPKAGAAELIGATTQLSGAAGSVMFSSVSSIAGDFILSRFTCQTRK